MTSRRRVVVLPGFFDRLDDLLPAERTAAGHPSTADFALHDLTAVIDSLADDYEGSTLPVPDTDVRHRTLAAAFGWARPGSATRSAYPRWPG